MVNNILIAIGIVLFVMLIIHTRKHFVFKRRLETILIAVAGILIFADLIAPIFNLDFNIKDNLVNAIFFIVFTSLISDIIYKKDRT